MNRKRVPIKIFEDDLQASVAVAKRIAKVIREKKATGKPAVLGLATGNTPVKMYRELIRMYQEEKLDFSDVITFNLDEYWPISKSSLQSYHIFMHEIFFKHINIDTKNIHIPSGEWHEEEIDTRCREYEELIAENGGIDVQILGIGRSGHIGFNEPGSEQNSRTRMLYLDKKTRLDAASGFFGEENVPKMAITMGVGTIMEAHEICLMAFGEKKASIIRRAAEDDISSTVSASFLREHSNTTFYLDKSASEELTPLCPP